MSETDVAEAGKKRDRSPSFPYIGLGKALERIQILFNKAKRHEARVADVAKDWGLAPKSSSTDRNVAALLAYGLVEDNGSGETRKIKISETGWRILEDKRPGVREKLVAEAALKPKVINEYAELWKDGRPDEGHCISQLKFEGGFTDEGARMFLRVFDETMRFAKGHNSATGAASDVEKERLETRVEVGNFVQWTSGGVDQFKDPARVVGVSEDGQWLWVEGSSTGIAVSETQIVQPPAGPPAGGPPPPPPGVVASLKPRPYGGIREEKFALKEGDVVISFPEGLSSDSVEDLDAYIQVFLKKAKREANALKKSVE